jgi:hypothetical protein
MAAIYCRTLTAETRFVIYTNTDEKHQIYWANSTNKSREYLPRSHA